MTKISEYVNRIAKRGGMALSTGYTVKFVLDNGDSTGSLKDYIASTGVSEDIYEGFCDEANLPPSQSATGQLTGRYLGEGAISYPHTKMYTDFSLSWMADANMEPYKFAQAWWQFIFQETNPSDNEVYDKDGYYPAKTNLDTKSMLSDSDTKVRNRSTRLRFPEKYLATVMIGKAEKGHDSDIGRCSTVHVMQEAYPYSVDSVPLSFSGSSQLVKVTANFYYSKHFVKYNDITKLDTPPEKLKAFNPD